MPTGCYIQMHEITRSSTLEKYIGEHVIPVILQLEKLGEHTAYLHAEIDNDGNRKVRGIICLDGKNYECELAEGVSPNGKLLIMPLDDGSYL